MLYLDSRDVPRPPSRMRILDGIFLIVEMLVVVKNEIVPTPNSKEEI